MPDIRTLLRVLVLSMQLLALSTTAAFAHAQLLETNPAQNAVIEQAPDVLTLTFSEPVSALIISLIAPDGSQTDLTSATKNGQIVTVQLPGDLGHGTHVLSWRIISVDAHPVAGSVIFSIGENTGETAIGVSLSGKMVMAALWFVKAGMFATLFFGVGGAVFSLVARLSNPVRQRTIHLIMAGLIITPLSLGLHGLDALGAPLSAIFSITPWATASGTTYLAMILAAELSLLLAFCALIVSRLRPLAWTAWFCAALAPALSGHAGGADPQWLTRPLVAMHIAGLVVWAGALVPLWHHLKERSDASDEALTQFSRFVPFAVAPLILSGVVLAAIQVGKPGPHWFSAYGAILAAKLILLIVLFGLAIWNRLWLTAPALAANNMARYRLRQSIRAEIILVVMIFVLVAGWRFTPPPRALALLPAPTAAAPLFNHVMDAGLMANIVTTPGQPGPVSMEISIMDMEGQPVDPITVSVTLTAPDLGIEPFSQAAVLGGDIWQVPNLSIPASGIWHLTLEIRQTRFNLVRLETSLEMAGAETMR